MCERFRINGKPISKETYLKHHQRVWTKLQEIKNRSKEERPPYITRWPGFFHFLTLVGFSLFLEEDVDVVVLEVGGDRNAARVCEGSGWIKSAIVMNRLLVAGGGRPESSF